MSHLTNDPLVAFLYELTRDHTPLYIVRKIVTQDSQHPRETIWRLTDEERARACVDFARTLRRRDPLPAIVPPVVEVKS